MLAGRPSPRDLATQCGLSYRHLVCVVNGREPMTLTDAQDLATVLDVPVQWLRYGWPGTDAAS